MVTFLKIIIIISNEVSWLRSHPDKFSSYRGDFSPFISIKNVKLFLVSPSVIFFFFFYKCIAIDGKLLHQILNLDLKERTRNIFVYDAAFSERRGKYPNFKIFNLDHDF